MLRRGMRLLWLFLHLLVGFGLAYGILTWLNPQRRARVIRAWMRGLCRVLGLRVQVSGVPVQGPLLLVANHISWLDIPALMVAVETVYIAKDEIRTWPVIGGLATRSGTLFIRRGAGAQAVHHAMAHRLTQGGHITVFPEATTSDGRDVRPFHGRLYQAALDAHCAVQAVALTYPHPAGVHPLAPLRDDLSLVAHLWQVLGEARMDVHLHFHLPWSTHGLHRKELAQRTRQQILGAIQLRNGG